MESVASREARASAKCRAYRAKEATQTGPENERNARAYVNCAASTVCKPALGPLPLDLTASIKAYDLEWAGPHTLRLSWNGTARFLTSSEIVLEFQVTRHVHLQQTHFLHVFYKFPRLVFAINKFRTCTTSCDLLKMLFVCLLIP